MISDIQGYRSIFAFGEMSVGEGAPSRTNCMILDTQGHRSHISALGELIVDACVIQRTKNMISDIQRRRSSVSALGELIVDGLCNPLAPEYDFRHPGIEHT